MQSITDKIVARLYRKGRGFAFSGVDFADLGTRVSVDKSLSVLAKAGTIRRLRRGLYDYPLYNDKLGGVLSPDIHQNALAIGRQNGIKVQASGAWAANLLGLSNQVPAQIVYLTNGKSRTVDISGQSIRFVKVPPKQMQPGHELSQLVGHALRWLGQSAVDDDVIASVRRRLDLRQRKRLLKDLRYSEIWIFESAQRIAAGDGDA